MAAYKRKTKDEYYIEQNWGQGWEEVSSYDTLGDMLKDLKLYRSEQPLTPARWKTRRIKIDG